MHIKKLRCVSDLIYMFPYKPRCTSLYICHQCKERKIKGAGDTLNYAAIICRKCDTYTMYNITWYLYNDISYLEEIVSRDLYHEYSDEPFPKKKTPIKDFFYDLWYPVPDTTDESFTRTLSFIMFCSVSFILYCLFWR